MRSRHGYRLAPKKVGADGIGAELVAWDYLPATESYGLLPINAAGPVNIRMSSPPPMRSTL
jgi:hypothetical protein